MTSEITSSDGPHRGGAPVNPAPYDVYARLEDPMGVLAIALGQWEDRDDSKPQPEVRRAANTAMTEIDRMLGELHAMRARLRETQEPGLRSLAQRFLRLRADHDDGPGRPELSWSAPGRLRRRGAWPGPGRT
jgi:hypothetical protein